MAPDFFSDHFGTGVATSLAGEIAYDSQKRISAGLGHARLRRKRASITVGTAAGIGEGLRMMQFKSGDRIYNCVLTATGGTAGAADIGVYKSGFAHDGVVIDADLFGSAVTIAGGVARVDQFTESAILANIDRGKPLWTLADIGAGTYTVDPMEDWDIVLTITTAITVSLITLNLEVEYTAGD